MSTIKHLINVLFLGALCASLGLVCGTNLLAPRVAALEALADEQLVVVDANGIVVGSADLPGFFGGGPNDLNVLVQTGDGDPPLPVYIQRDRALGTHTEVLFTSSDCSGDPYFRSDHWLVLRVLPRTMVQSDANGAAIFYSDIANPEPLYLENLASAMSQEGYCSEFPNLQDLWVVRGFRPSLQPFTPPYSVVTRGELVAP